MGADGLGSPAYLYVASLLVFFRAIALLCAVDASTHVEIAGAHLGSELQVFATCLALAGVPALIMANFGLHWHVEHYVRRFFYYLAASLVFDCLALIQLPFVSDMCSALANPYVLSNGRIFVCSFINAAYGFWSLVFLGVEFHVVVQVRQQAEILRVGEYAELLRYETTPSNLNKFTAG